MRKLILSLGLAAALPLSIADGQEPFIPKTSLSTIETQFYNLNLHEYDLLGDSILVENAPDEGIVIAKRYEKRINVAKFKNGNLLLGESVKIPSDIMKNNFPNTLILDIATNKEFLFVAIGVQVAESSSECGGVWLLKYNFANLQDSKLIFSSTPCIRGTIGQFPWTSRIALSSDSLWITGGNLLVDFQFGTFPSTEVPYLKRFSNQLPTTNFYGKVVKIDSKENIISFAQGVRNLGGLVYFKGALYLTDNGPRGGDTLNIVKKGMKLSWPSSTLGRPYGAETTENNQVSINTYPERHGAIFSWTPSISPSELVFIEGSPFNFWKSNLIIASLKDRSLHRLFIHGDRVIYDERILIGERLRSLILLSSGQLLAGTDNGKVLLISPSVNSPNGPFPAITP